MTGSLPPRATAHATVSGSFVEGWRRVLTAPVAAGGFLAAGLAFTLAPFGADPLGLGELLFHQILGFDGTPSFVLDLRLHRAAGTAPAGTIAAYVILWLFLAGGLIDRLARGRVVRAPAFFGACGAHAGAFLRLAVIVGAVDWLLLAWVGRVSQGATPGGDLLVPGPAGSWPLAIVWWAATLGLALTCLVADYARIRLVVEGRRSAVAALGAAWRFVRRRPGRTAALYLLNVVAGLVPLALWAAAGPAAGGFGGVAIALYLVLRAATRLAFIATEIAFFQGELAHAGYTAPAVPIWPESPAVEAMARLVDRVDETRPPRAER
ncbi:MAG: hypothetical protein R2752_11260 [Vicinamibacterales bacterium]